jgi:hypothetical protein
MKANYQATLFHPEGDFVTDFRERENKSDVWDEINDMGSRWIFYPIPFVTTHITIVDTPEGLEFLKGKRIKTAVSYFKNAWEHDAESICNDINAGIPYCFIFPPL